MTIRPFIASQDSHTGQPSYDYYHFRAFLMILSVLVKEDTKEIHKTAIALLAVKNDKNVGILGVPIESIVFPYFL